MDDNEKIRRYYESLLNRTALAPPPEDLLLSAARVVPGRMPGVKNIIGLIVTVAYLLQFLLPMNWFSLGRFMFMVRLGF